MVIPRYGIGVGKFCRWFKTEDFCSFTGSQIHPCAKFGENEIKRLTGLGVITEDRDTFDPYDSFQPPTNDTDFTSLCAASGDHHDSLKFVMKRQKLKEIWSNSEKGKSIQIFDVSFENACQPCHPILTISENSGLSPGLLFQSKNNVFVAVGKIENHYSMNISSYQKIAGHDPFFEHCQAQYYDPVFFETTANRMSFNDYYEKEKNMLAEFLNWADLRLC